MPFITIDTNANSKVDKDAIAKLSKTAAQILRKPEGAMIVKINTGMNIVFGSVPAATGALIEVKSVGYGANKAELVSALTQFAMQEFNAEQKYVSMHLVDMPPANVGENGMLKG